MNLSDRRGERVEAPSAKIEQGESGNLTSRSFHFWYALGPGIIASISGNDVGGINTMAALGAQTRFRFIGFQLFLMVVLYCVQEAVARVGICSRLSILEFTRHRFGDNAAIGLTVCMAVISLAVFVCQFTGVVAVGQMFGISFVPSIALTFIMLLSIVWISIYSILEKFLLFLGFCITGYFVALYLCDPPWDEIVASLGKWPVESSSDVDWMLALVGTTVAPYMMFFQGSAYLEKNLGPQHLPWVRLDTFLGVIVSQLLMISVVIVHAVEPTRVLQQDLSSQSSAQHGSMAATFLEPLIPLLGIARAKIMVTVVLVAAALLTMLVVATGFAWNFATCWLDAASLKGDLTNTKDFRGLFTVAVILASAVVFFSQPFISLPELNVFLQLFQSLALPVLVGIVLVIASSDALQPEHRITGLHKRCLCGIVIALTLVIGFGLAEDIGSPISSWFSKHHTRTALHQLSDFSVPNYLRGRDLRKLNLRQVDGSQRIQIGY